MKVSQALIQTLSTAQEDRLRRKKQKIEAYFGRGLEGKEIESYAFTLLVERKQVGGVVGGYFLRINGKKRGRTLVASEGYCLDEVRAHLLSPLFYALYHLHCLDLAKDKPVSFYIVSSFFEEILSIIDEKGSQDLMVQGVQCLLKDFSEVSFLPCIQGGFFEKMQTKLYQIKHGNRNDLVSLDFEEIIQTALVPS